MKSDDTFKLSDASIHVTLGNLTKREYFAAKAIQGLASTFPEFGKSHAEHIAKHAVEIADCILKELEIKKP